MFHSTTLRSKKEETRDGGIRRRRRRQSDISGLRTIDPSKRIETQLNDGQEKAERKKIEVCYRDPILGC